MPARLKSLLLEFGVPLILFGMALGAAEWKLSQKEDASAHQVDIQKLEEQQNATYSLLLDVRCEQKPNDRRCK